jgi:uncharacterized membrane protein
VSELIVFGFRDQYRAAEVLNDLKRREWEWAGDLDDAVTVMLGQDGKARVQLSVDLSTGEAAPWARVWGSLLSLTLFQPSVEIMADAANGISSAFLPHCCSGDKQMMRPDCKWWKERLRLSDTFVRDVAAVAQPGGSAIFMLLRTANIPAALEQLRNYGNTLLHTRLSAEQDQEMNTVLTAG